MLIRYIYINIIIHDRSNNYKFIQDTAKDIGRLTIKDWSTARSRVAIPDKEEVKVLLCNVVSMQS